MTPADIVGYIGFVPLMFGTYLLTTRTKQMGWGVRIIGDILLAVSGFLGGLYSIVLISSSFAGLDVIGLMKLRRAEKVVPEVQALARYRRTDGS